MHENFCEQHVKKCDICGEVINKEEEEEHIEETHSMKKCEICGDEFIASEYYKHRPNCESNVECIYCKMEFRPKEVIMHQMNCEYNMYQCYFCFANIANKDKINHEIFCGSRTEKCKTCGKYVMLNKMNFHISMDCHPEEVPISKQIDINNIPIKKKSNAKPVIMCNIIFLILI